MGIINAFRNYPKIDYVLLLWPLCMLFLFNIPFKIFFQPTAIISILILPFIYLKTSNHIDKNQKAIKLSFLYLGVLGLILVSVFLGEGLTSGENGEINYEVFGKTLAGFVAGAFYAFTFSIYVITKVKTKGILKLEQKEDKAA